MSTKGPYRDRGFVVGGPMVNSAIGDGNVVRGNRAIGFNRVETAALEDLRQEIVALLTQVETAGGDDATEERIRYELQTIKEELDEDEPEGAVVRSRWKQVQKLLAPLQHVATITQSAERVLTLVHTLFGGG